MGTLKSVADTGRGIVKTVTKPIARPLEKVLKPVFTPLRPVVSKAIPFIPGTSGAALVLKAKAFGIKSERGVAGYKRSQKVSRIGTAAVAAVAGAVVAAPVVAGAVGGIGLPSLGTVVSGAGALLPVVLGGGGPTEGASWNPESGGGVPDSFGGGGGGGGGGFGLDPADYVPSPAWPARPNVPAQAPPGLSPVVTLAGVGVGLYLLTKGG
jgi:hypothetical protein